MSAKIERTHVPGGYAGDTHYVITGSREEVDEAAAKVMVAYNPCGYGTRFEPPVEIEGGLWRRVGARSNSCD